MGTLQEVLMVCAQEYLRACLEQAGGNVSKAAETARVHRSTFYLLCGKCGVSIRGVTATPSVSNQALSRWLGAKNFERKV